MKGEFDCGGMIPCFLDNSFSCSRFCVWHNKEQVCARCALTRSRRGDGEATAGGRSDVCADMLELTIIGGWAFHRILPATGSLGTYLYRYRYPLGYGTV
jgi:hypothetical protein